ncbi:MAG: ABC transporter ATP-binding protein [Deltaproteobacteria bacterium]|nr:ABC transporter ATP-binding protein [Deltaproteobacteria bacterium]
MNNIFKIANLNVRYNDTTPVVLHDISLNCKKYQSISLIGESGSGKTTLAKVIMGVLPPFSGSVNVFGKDIYSRDFHDIKTLRRRYQMIFQDSQAVFDPLMKIGKSLEEILYINNMRDDYSKRISKVLELVKLPENVLGKYISELSGGLRQRAGIARALLTEPEFLIADEPTSALDVSLQGMIIKLFQEIQKTATFMFITHDLALITHISEKVLVLYNGYAVEYGPTADVISKPRHPYTELLISAHRFRVGRKTTGINSPDTNCCPFVNYCKRKRKICEEVFPDLKTEENRSYRCHFPL